ncbi:MAG: hypothetical protein CMF62_03860 [Magnetococcales bacterium]|nr:hypothetical protein [Magnetococcales bacterium]
MLFGLFYYENYDRRGKIIDIDWKKFRYIIKKFILNDLKNNSIHYDIYIVTNKSTIKEEKELINFYNPIKYKFYDIKEFNENGKTSDLSYESRNRKMKIGLEMIKNTNNYDSIIATRFDPIFKLSFTKYNISWNLFNFHYFQIDMVDDNLFVFNNKYLDMMIKFLEENINKRGHDFYNLLPIPKNEINFLATKENKHRFFSLPNYYSKVISGNAINIQSS